MSGITRMGTLLPGERFPSEEEEAACIEVTCPTCKSVGYALPTTVARCPNCGTRVQAPMMGVPIPKAPEKVSYPMSDGPATKCTEMVHPDYDRRKDLPPHRCPHNAVHDGYCRRHHPRQRLAVLDRQLKKWKQRHRELLNQRSELLRVCMEKGMGPWIWD